MGNRVGRKSKYDPESTPRQAEVYASEVLTDPQISAKLGINIETYYVWQKKYPEFTQAIKRGKAASNQRLIEAMQKNAAGYDVEETEEIEILDKDKKPKGYRKTTRKRHIPPSTTMQIFLAKNRMPEDFRDVNRHEVDVRGELKVNTLAELMLDEFKNEEDKEATESTTESLRD